MELLLVRHAQPHLVPHSADGAADPALTDEGKFQARAVARLLASDAYGSIGAVVSSSMRRALETAAPTAEALGLAVTSDDRLVEIDHGSSQYGFGFERFATRAEAWEAIDAGSWEGFTFDPVAFAARVVEGVEEIVARHPRGQVAVFCHGGVVSAYLGHVLGMQRRIFFSPDYTGVTRILAEPGGYREMLSVNERGHLAAAASPRHVSTP